MPFNLKSQILNPKFLFLLAPLLLSACNGGLARSADDSKDLAPIQYTVRAMYDGRQRTLLITPQGSLRLVDEVRDKPVVPIVADLTPDERRSLIDAFKGWSKLKDSYAVDVSPQVVITYNGKAVTTSRPDLVPQPFTRAKDALDKIIFAVSAEAAKYQPATGTAPAPATAPASQ
jgi:hypothetical protein